MTREEWNHINDDLINVFHWIEEFEETHPDTELQDEPIEEGDDRR